MTAVSPKVRDPEEIRAVSALPSKLVFRVIVPGSSTKKGAVWTV